MCEEQLYHQPDIVREMKTRIVDDKEVQVQSVDNYDLSIVFIVTLLHDLNSHTLLELLI
jgi:hypothetical protein